ncbi:polysaccharide pyruvyl transferase family protein [Vibrio sp. A2-1]|uniref:polysaccharide pyruvyl transferase family protein n=1 Tax=Vibrio sp. A2-1 TaxID=2912252 RepID=UPI001F2D7873|nr:polysaccharide pyruvyl transferase family protein [Vibrio sp. A2-1]MCF7487635.1 polysaccharide pyruvyl transferase family protein [Vibrio sp. A2-1]
MNCFTIGYFQDNLGDDLMLSILAKSNPNKNFRVTNWKDSKLLSFEKIDNVELSNVNIIRELFRCQEIVFIGGSLFMDSKPTSWIYYMKLFLFLALGRVLKKNIYVFSSNIGPILDKRTKFFSKLIFKLCKRIIVRDLTSYEFVSKLNHSDVLISKDIVEYLPVVQSEVVSGRLGVSVLGSGPWEQNKYENNLIESIWEKVNSGYSQVYLFSFKNTQDLKLCQKLYNIFHSNGVFVKIIPYDDVDRFLLEFSYLDYVICTRFHSVILSMVYNVNFSVFIYSNKISDYLNTNYNITVPDKSESIVDVSLENKLTSSKENPYVFS